MRLPLESRVLFAVAAALVPRDLRPGWRREWEAELWWCQPFSRLELLQRISGAIPDALCLRIDQADVLPVFRRTLPRPSTCLAALLLLIAALASASHGFRHTRRALAPVQLPRLAILSQTGPFMGQRLGLPAAKLAIWTSRARTLEGASVYIFYRSVVSIGAEPPRELSAAKAGPEFFSLLGVPAPLCADCVVLGPRFSGELTGRTVIVDGRRARVTAVLPRAFWFLDAAPAVWTLWDPASWRAFPDSLTGAVCRLKPGVAPATAERELRQLAAQTEPWAPGRRISVDPLRDIARRPLTALGPMWLAFLLASCLASLAASHGRLFLMLKSALALVAVLLVDLEFGGATAITSTGGASFGDEAVAFWLLLTGSGLALWWSWRDHRQRCHHCLTRLSMPVRITQAARYLLEPSGIELMCPHGHGTLLTTEGSTPESHWAPLEIEV